MSRWPVLLQGPRSCEGEGLIEAEVKPHPAGIDGSFQAKQR